MCLIFCADIFFGHTHEDQASIFYANNATNISAESALTTSWMGPSITPGTNLNSGFRMYEVDSSVRPSYHLYQHSTHHHHLHHL
jgi:hypothetical protein